MPIEIHKAAAAVRPVLPPQCNQSIIDFSSISGIKPQNSDLDLKLSQVQGCWCLGFHDGSFFVLHLHSPKSNDDVLKKKKENVKLKQKQQPSSQLSNEELFSLL